MCYVLSSVSDLATRGARHRQALAMIAEQYESVLQTTGSAVICIARDHEILTWNHGAELVFGYSAGEVLGRDYFELFLPSEHRRGVDAQIEKVFAGEVLRNYENPVIGRDGRRRIMIWNSTRLLDPDGAPFAIVAIGQDVSSLRQVEALQAGESRALELLVRGVDFQEVLDELAAAIETVCQGVLCAVMEAETEPGHLRCAAAPSLPAEFRSAIDGVAIGERGASCGAAAQRRVLVMTPEIASDPCWSSHRQPAMMQGLNGAWSHPVLSAAGSLLGTVDAYTQRSRRPTRFELETTERVARIVGLAIEHQQAQERLVKESEDRFRNAVTELETLREELRGKFSFEDMVAVSPAMLRVIRMAARVAPTEATILVTGETGTGKEVLARAVHSNSPRRDRPFIAVNCGAIPETLMESELFGHERGAFTGAERLKPGQIERARGGTLFLDEVGELVPAAPVKLLRVLQERTFERLGGTEVLTADVRVIAATNRNLESEMEDGRFRDDLFYRLNVFHIHLPPLRDRREAIPALSERILERIATQLGRPEIGLSKSAMKVLQDYDWKGNVRELQNALERASILCGGSLIGPDHLPIVSPAGPLERLASSENDIVVRLGGEFTLEKLEQRLVRLAIKLARGNKSKAARLLGISRGSLRWRLEKK